MIFEEQSTIEHMVYRILTHTQSLIQCQRVQVWKKIHFLHFSSYILISCSSLHYCSLEFRFCLCIKHLKEVSLVFLILRQMI